MCCFLGNGPYSVGLEEESKGNVMLNSVLEFKAPRVQEGSGHTRLQSPKMPSRVGSDTRQTTDGMKARW